MQRRVIEEAVVRSSVRKCLGVIVVTMLGALFALPMVGAGAQEVAADSNCVIQSVSPNPVPSFPAVVTVAGTAPTGSHVTLYGQTPPGTGSTTALASQDVTTGSFSLQANLTGPTSLSANFTTGDQSAYATSCSAVEGEVVITVEAAGASRDPGATAAARTLAFTGSSNTPSFVVIGVAAVAFGAILVVAARRRKQLS